MTADYFVVGARTGAAGLGGISLFFVDKETPGFERVPLERKMARRPRIERRTFTDRSPCCTLPLVALLI